MFFQFKFKQIKFSDSELSVPKVLKKNIKMINDKLVYICNNINNNQTNKLHNWYKYK